MQVEKYFYFSSNKRFSSIRGDTEIKISITVNTVHKVKFPMVVLIVLDMSNRTSHTYM